MNKNMLSQITTEDERILRHIIDRCLELKVDHPLTVAEIYGAEKWRDDVTRQSYIGRLVSAAARAGLLPLRRAGKNRNSNHALYVIDRSIGMNSQAVA